MATQLTTIQPFSINTSTTDPFTFANLVVSANANLGAVGNIIITGGSANYLLKTNGSGTLTWVAPVTPGGSNTYVQFNDASSFGGVSALAFDKSSNVLTLGGNLTTSNANLGNAAVANYFIGNFYGTANSAGTVTTNAQPNITSVGSLTGLTVSNATGIVNFTTTANVTLGAVANLHISGGSSGYLLSTDGSGTLSWAAAASGSNISNGTSNVNIAASGGNVTVGVAGNAAIITATGTGVNVAGYLTATGNVTGNYFIGNGSQLTGLTAGTNVTNGNSNVTVIANGNVTTSVAGTANVMVVTSTGANVAGYLTVSGNISAGNFVTAGSGGNFSGANVISANTLTATGNVTGANLITAGNIFAPVIVQNASTYDTRIALDSPSGLVQITSAGNSTQFTPSGQINLGGVSQIKGGTFSGSYLTLGTSQTDLAQDRGGNVTVQVGTGGTIANTWTFAQNGSFTSPGNITTTANANLGNVNTAQLLATANVTAPQLISNVATGTAPFVVTSTTQVANLNVATAGQATTAGTVTTNAQPNITSVGSLTGLTVSNATGVVNFTTTANVTLGAVANLHISGGTNGQYLQTDGSGALSWATVTSGSSSNISNGNSNVNIPVANGNVNISAVGNANVVVVTGTGVNVAGYTTITGNLTAGNINAGSGTGGNITGANLVSANYLTGTLTTAAQPNVTSVGTLTGLTSNGVVNFANTSNATLGAVGNVHISGGTNGQYLQTDGSGTLSWSTVISGSSSNISNGNSNVNIPSANGNINLTAVGNTTMVVTGTGVNVAGYTTITGNLTAGNINAGSGTGGNITGANLVSANYLTGTLTTAAQPNITSVGTLTSLTVTGNITSGNANLGNSVTANYFTGNFYGTANSATTAGTVTTAAQPNITSVGSLTGLTVSNATGVVNFTTTANVTLGAVANLHISGGTTGQYLSTDGSGTLSWATVSSGAASNISNGNSNVNIPAANGNVNISAVGNANIVVVTGTGANISGTLNVTGNATVGNIVTSGSGGNVSNVNVISANTFIASGNLTAGNINTTGSGGNIGNANVISANTFTASGNITSANANLGNSVVANYFTGNFYGTANLATYATTANAVAGGNVSGQVANSLIAGTVYTNAQPNITSVGSLTGLTVSNATGVVNFTTSANVTLGAVANLHISGGTTGQYLSTDGSGTLTWSTVSSGASSNISNGNSNVNIPAANGNVNISAVGNANVLVITGTGINVAGTLNATGNASLGNLVTSGSGGNIANANVISANTFTASGNITGANANLGNAVTANYFTGNFYGTANLATYATTANAVAGANVSGQVGNALVAGTVYTNAQPNITSVGSLIGLTVSNATGVVNFTTTANVTLGAVANLHISGGTSGQYLSTDGSGTLTWSTVAGGSSSNISNGNSNVNIPSANGNVNISAVGNANILVVTGTGVNVAGTLNVTGQSNLGAVGNVKITGGTANYLLSTDGAGNLSWTAAPAGANVTVDNFTGNGVQTIFTLSTTPIGINQTSVNYNGATVLRTDYTLANANITFSSAPANGSYIEVTTINLTAGGGGGTSAAAAVGYSLIFGG